MKGGEYKNYRVSLALKVYANFETEVKAKNEKEALDKAIDKYDKGEYDDCDITEPDWTDAELDIQEEKGVLGDGIYIEEV